MKFNKKTITIGVISLAGILVLIALVNSTYALFSSDAYGSNLNSYSTGMLSIEVSSKSENISLTNVLPMSDEDGLLTTPYVFSIKNIGNLDYEFDVKLLSTGTSDTTFSSQYIKLQIDDGEVTTLSALSSSIIKDKIVLHAGESIDISIRIWLSSDTPNSELGKGFTSKIVTDGQAIYTSSNNEYKVKLVNHISNLYNNATKTTVTNNGITYNYATSVGLMNDRLGNSTTSINDGNIRYYGANPYNYIDIGDQYEQNVVKGNWEDYGMTGAFSTSSECYTFFGDENLINMEACTDATTCETFRTNILVEHGASSVSEVCEVSTIPAGTPILYRIIGLFKDVELADGTKKDLVKVIRATPIGNYSWDQSESTVNSGYGVNEWSQADLMKLLNPTYENENVGGSLYWNSGSGSCYGYDINNEEYTSIPCDFTNTGLSTSAQSNIEVVKWNLGGWNTYSVFANQMYYYERQGNVVIPGTICSGDSCNDTVTRTTVWEGRVALAYPSDYGYAVDLNSCDSVLSEYENCTGDNWMHSSIIKGSDSWLLTPYSVRANGAWYVVDVGYVWPYNNVHDNNGVSPVFYLDSELIIESGTGMSNDPYVLW